MHAFPLTIFIHKLFPLFSILLITQHFRDFPLSIFLIFRSCPVSENPVPHLLHEFAEVLEGIRYTFVGVLVFLLNVPLDAYDTRSGTLYLKKESRDIMFNIQGPHSNWRITFFRSTGKNCPTRREEEGKETERRPNNNLARSAGKRPGRTGSHSRWSH